MFSLEKHYALHSEQIYQFIYFLTFDHTLAEDLLQETFLRAHKARHTYRGEANALTWLRKIAKHTVVDHFKSKKKSFWKFYEEIPDDVQTPLSTEELLTLEEAKHNLYVAISKLKLEYRLAIILRKIEELSVAETAATLEWSESKVKNNTERGMKALKELMIGGDLNG